MAYAKIITRETDPKDKEVPDEQTYLILQQYSLPDVIE